ncbi:Ger(x)C family spore germination C-terminal domain-containing protein [Bacillus velezensis]
MAAEKLIDLTNNGGYNGKILKPLRIGRASIYCHNKLSFLIQAVSNQKGKTVYDGAAIIKNAKQNRLAGFLSSYEIQSLNWLMGTIQGGVLPALDKGGHPITFEIKKSTSYHHSQAEKREAVISCSGKNKRTFVRGSICRRRFIRSALFKRAGKDFRKKTEKRCERSHR